MQSVEDIDHQTVLSLAYSKTIPQEQLKGLTKIELAKLAEYIAMGTNTKEGMEKIQEYNTGIKALLNREGTVLADHTGLDVFAKKVEGILQAALNGEEQRMKEMKQRSKEVVFGDEGITEGKRKTFMNKKRKIPSLSQVTVLQHETKGSVFAQPQRNRFG